MSRRLDRPRHAAVRRQGRIRFWFALLLGLFIGTALLAWFAPAIVARTSIVQQIVAKQTKDLGADVTVGRVSLGWMSPVVVRDVVAQDKQGQPLAQVAAVRTSKTLFSLVTDTHNLGTLVIEQPRVQLLLKPDGSNLEEAIWPWLSKSEEPADIGCDVEIREGVVEILEQTTGQRWMAEVGTASVQLPRDRSQPMALRAQTTVHAVQEPPAPCVAELQMQRSGAMAGQAALRVSALPLGLARAAAQRFVPGAQLEGVLAGQVAVAWSSEQIEAKTDDVRVERFLLSNPAWLGKDVLRFQQVDLRGEWSYAKGMWTARKARLATEVATLDISGSGPIPGNCKEGCLSALLDARGDLKVDADLARLASLLPDTLRVREATRISSGRATVQVSSGAQNNGRVWDGTLSIQNLAAVHQGRRIEWDQPVEVVATAVQNGDLWSVRQLTCRSSFLNLSGQGSWSEGSLQLDGDLARFAQEASQFVDLGGLGLSGRLTADASWQSTPDGQVTLSGQGVAESLNVAIPGSRPLREQHLELQVAARGRLASGRIARMDAGKIQLLSEGDQLIARLTEPVNMESQVIWPVQLHVEGGLRSWLPRVQSLVPLAGWELAGAGKLDVDGRFSGDRAELKLVKLDVSDLAAKVGDIVIREPAMQMETSAAWDRATGDIRSTALTFASTAVALRASDVRVQSKDGKTTVAGDATYRLQLDRLMAWLAGAQAAPPSFHLAGEATGRAQLSSTGSVTTGTCTAEVSNFAYSTPSKSAVSPNAAAGWETVWNEPRLNVAAKGSYDAEKSLLDLAEFQLAGQAMSGAAKGQIRDPAGRCYLDLQGSLAYDLQQLVPRLSPSLAAQLQMAGRDTKPFRIEGPLFATSSTGAGSPSIRQASVTTASRGSSLAMREMKGQASLGWESVAFAGVTLGPGSVDTQLVDGVVSIAPMDLPLSDGKLRLAPSIDLTKEVAVLTQPAGPFVEQVRLSPEMCRSWLKYVAPLIADATAAEGQFSVTLDGAAVPLSNPSAGEVKGVLNVHSARVGPGPLSQQLLGAAEQIKALVQRRAPQAGSGSDKWLELPAQQVQFQMQDGRVHHEGLQLLIGDVVVRTKGSVGIDESLYLVAEVPLRDEWIANDRYLSSLKGQTVQLPIQGTLKRPGVDMRALANLSRQTVTGAASQLLQQELGRGLDRLLRPTTPTQTPSETQNVLP